MVLGAITGTYVGTAEITSASFKALLDAVNCGAATAGAETTSIIVIPIQNATGNQAAVWKIARAGA